MVEKHVDSFKTSPEKKNKQKALDTNKNKRFHSMKSTVLFNHLAH